jgi:hypothetical protein
MFKDNPINVFNCNIISSKKAKGNALKKYVIFSLVLINTLLILIKLQDSIIKRIRTRAQLLAALLQSIIDLALHFIIGEL